MDKAPYHCCVPGCEEHAAVEVYLYDVYAHSTGEVFMEIDNTCQFMCTEHMKQNEIQAKGERKPRGMVEYPYSNQNRAQGFTVYRELG